MTGTVLILGASGRFGRHCHAAFARAGWEIRIFDRTRDDLWDAAWGADVIVNGWNIAYHKWAEAIPLQTAQIIEVAKASGATVIQPGNVYVYGSDAQPVFGPDTPHTAINALGQIKIAQEAAFKAAGIRTVILRAGDYIDDDPSGNWFDKILTKDWKRGRFSYPGPSDRKHAWAWLPDLARAAVMLAEKRPELPRFCDLTFPGYTLTGQQMVASLQDAVERQIQFKRMSWLPIRIATLFWPEAKHLLEMRYLWDKPHQLDGTAFRQLLPEFKGTPLTLALRSALQLDVEPDQTVGGCLCNRLRIDRPQTPARKLHVGKALFLR